MSTPTLFDIEKALKHAELTWAQDPFRKVTGLPGKPTFDIDFTKNPATSYNEVSTFNGLTRSRSSGRAAGARIKNARQRQKPVTQRRPTTAAVNGPNTHSSSTESQPHRGRSRNDVQLIIHDEQPVETILWTPALLRHFDKK